MLDQLDALRALHEAGTTRRAATRLRITQSAVSKRIAALEVRVGAPLLERHGRNARLTPAGLRLLEDALPLLRALEERLTALDTAGVATVRIAATESLVASWLPAVLRAAVDTPGAAPRLELHAHRGPLALERLRAGEVDLAVVVSGAEEGLHVEPLGSEPMVLVPSGEAPLSPAPGAVVPVWTIEPGSLTGAWLARRLARARGPWRVEVVARIESFGSAVQMARAGFGHALVPIGIARSLGVSDAVLVPLPGGIARPVVLCARPSGWERPAVRRFGEAVVVASRGAPWRTGG
ncbi:MAG: LysR family transcriptional regulator [Myxococcota bacterium]